MLKSGGEVMTVEAVDEWIECVWFNGKKVERSSFDPRTLKKYDDTFPGL
jgi:uncharacterized protein YodC (DUF2158 family)